MFHINAKALAGNGSLVKDAPLDYAYFGKAGYGEYGLPASIHFEDGRFVAETPGLYTLVVSSGSYSSQKKVNVVSRNVKKEVRLVGHGLISNVKSGDLWVWPGRQAQWKRLCSYRKYFWRWRSIFLGCNRSGEYENN